MAGFFLILSEPKTTTFCYNRLLLITMRGYVKFVETVRSLFIFFNVLRIGK